MNMREYEFRFVSRRQKAELIACKVAAVLPVLASQALLVLDKEMALGSKLLCAAVPFAALFVYTNLMRVKADVRELLRAPFAFCCLELPVITALLALAAAVA